MQWWLWGERKTNDKTFVRVLVSCGNLSDLERGRWECIAWFVRGGRDFFLMYYFLLLRWQCMPSVGWWGQQRRYFIWWPKGVLHPRINDQRLWIAWVQAYNYKALDLLMEMEKNVPQFLKQMRRLSSASWAPVPTEAWCLNAVSVLIGWLGSTILSPRLGTLVLWWTSFSLVVLDCLETQWSSSRICRQRCHGAEYHWKRRLYI